MSRFTPLVQSLPATVPFVGPETLERLHGKRFDARIGANESVFGPSPKAIAAMQHALAGSWAYGDPENHDLKAALAAHHGVEPKNIVVGEGVDGLLGYLVRMVVQQGTKVVTSLGAYPTFNFHVAGYGGELVTVPYRDDHEDPTALLERAKAERAPLVYFANPDNPMGSWHPAEVVQTLIDELPDESLLCLDEAYIEFAPNGTAPAIDVSKQNVIRFRTFSKAYGMAGVRVGYGIAHEDIALAFNKVRNHFGMSRIGQGGALAALADQDYLAEVVDKVAKSRTRIAEIAAKNGLEALPSATNFVAVDCKRDATFAKGVVDGLGQHGIFIRMPFVEPQNRCVRISAGSGAHLDMLEAALPEVLGDLQKQSIAV